MVKKQNNNLFNDGQRTQKRAMNEVRKLMKKTTMLRRCDRFW